MQLVPTEKHPKSRSSADPQVVKLRGLIAKKASEKRRIEREIENLAGEFAELQALSRRVLEPVDTKIHDHFAALLSGTLLEPEVLPDLRGLYAELMLSATISQRSVPGVELPRDEECSCPRCQGATDEPFEAEPYVGDEPTDAHARIHASPADAGPPSLRKLYRELATKFHPDKAHDQDTRAQHERLMREINSAYEANDLDSLAALSQELGFEIAGDDLLESLAVQYENLKREVRALRRSEPGSLVVEARSRARRGLPSPRDEMEASIREHGQHLRELERLFRSFRNGKLSQAAFLDELFGEDEEFDDFDLAQELLAAIGELETAVRAARPRRKR